MKDFFKNLSIKWKILIGAFAIFFFTIFISDGIFLFTIYKTLSYRNYVNDEKLADSLLPEIGYALHSNDIYYIKRYLNYDIKNYKTIKGVGLYSLKGKLITRGGSLINKAFSPRNDYSSLIKNNSNFHGLINNVKNIEAQFTLMGTHFYGNEEYEESGKDYPVIIKKVKYDGKNLGFAAIEFNLKREIISTDSRVFWVGVRFMAIASFFVGAGLLIFYYISNIITMPISEIKENIKKMKEGDYNIRFDKRFNDEIGSVMDALESMADSIREYAVKVELINKEKQELNCMAIMGELSANIAHEVKNAIYVISSANEYISQETKNKIVLEFIGIINNEVKRLNKMSVDFLSFAKQRNPELIATDINKVIDDAVRILKFEAESLKIALIQENGPIPEIHGDQEMLKQVVLNLIINAIDKKYQTNNKFIKVKTYLKEGSVNIEIEDNGEAIAEENIEKIFKPFFTTKNNGSGLGLPISMRIIKLHGGNITVSDGNGAGTVFIITVPVNFPN